MSILIVIVWNFVWIYVIARALWEYVFLQQTFEAKVAFVHAIFGIKAVVQKNWYILLLPIRIGT